jgi:hypothetical protein
MYPKFAELFKPTIFISSYRSLYCRTVQHLLFAGHTTLYSVTKTVSLNEKVMSELWIGKNLEGSGRGLILRYHPGICLQGHRKSTKNLGQDNQSTCRDLNPGPPEYEAEVLITYHDL